MIYDDMMNHGPCFVDGGKEVFLQQRFEFTIRLVKASWRCQHGQHAEKNKCDAKRDEAQWPRLGRARLR